MHKIRLFVAIDIPDDARTALTEVEEELRRVSPPAKWVRPEGLHLTLKFLGYVDPERLPDLTAALTGAVSDFGRFAYRLESVGAFPSVRRGRVVWAGVGEGAADCVRLAELVDEAFKPLGFEPEKRAFTPHITLARYKVPARLDDAALTAAARLLPDKTLAADRVTLFESRLKPSGATYIKIFEQSF